MVVLKVVVAFMIVAVMVLMLRVFAKLISACIKVVKLS